MGKQPVIQRVRVRHGWVVECMRARGKFLSQRELTLKAILYLRLRHTVMMRNRRFFSREQA
jgi:hypothetical protein